MTNNSEDGPFSSITIYDYLPIKHLHGETNILNMFYIMVN